jgi:hypothetical protein
MSDSHPILESGCLRKFAIHALRGMTSTVNTSDADIEINQLTESDSLRTLKIICNSDKYKRIEKIFQKHGGDCPTASQYTFGAHVTVEHHAWEIIVFEALYPPVGMVYLIFGCSRERETGSIAAIIDPEQSEIGDHTTVTAFEIDTERIKPIALTLDQRLTNPDGTHRESRSQSPQIGYQIAIDWFVL